MESSFSYTNTECEDAVFREDVTELTVDLSLRSSIEVTTQLVDFAKLNNAFCQDFVKYSVIKQPSALTTFALDEETGELTTQATGDQIVSVSTTATVQADLVSGALSTYKIIYVDVKLPPTDHAMPTFAGQIEVQSLVANEVTSWELP